ncbi:MAG: nucleotide exchange factor GrpE [Bdellovibrio sp.]|nr:nucleotide exchange factor GrpE [Bdellovibrio sp.]
MTSANEENSAQGAQSELNGKQAPEQTEQSGAETQMKKIADLEAQIKEKEAKYLYLYADFDNFKKRAVKERSDLIKFGWESLARELLQTVDNLERAVSHIPQGSDPSLAEGLNLVLAQFKASLSKYGVQNIDCLKMEFDPNLHEAIGQEPSELPSGTVVREHTRGYTLHGRLLRPARVSISSGRMGGI